MKVLFFKLLILIINFSKEPIDIKTTNFSKKI